MFRFPFIRTACLAALVMLLAACAAKGPSEPTLSESGMALPDNLRHLVIETMQEMREAGDTRPDDVLEIDAASRILAVISLDQAEAEAAPGTDRSYLAASHLLEEDARRLERASVKFRMEDVARRASLLYSQSAYYAHQMTDPNYQRTLILTRKSVDLNPTADYWQVWFNAGIAEYFTEHMAAAVIYATLAVELAPENEAVLRLRTAGSYYAIQQIIDGTYPKSAKAGVADYGMMMLTDTGELLKRPETATTDIVEYAVYAHIALATMANERIDRVAHAKDALALIEGHHESTEWMTRMGREAKKMMEEEQ